MKRLLAYLFIVLGLGLTFNIIAHATTIKFQNCVPGLKDGPFKDFGYWTTYEVDLKKNKVITTNGTLATDLRPASSYKIEHEIELNNSNKLLTKKVQLTKYKWSQLEFNKKTNKVREIRTAYLDGKVKKINGTWKLTDYRIDESFTYEHCDKVIGSWKNNKTQIAKAEPSQTQKVVKKENNRKDILKSYDNFLAKKYQITINNKNVDKLKNSFRGVSSNDFNNQTIIAKIDNTNLTTQNFVNFLNETGKSKPSIIDNLDNNIIEEFLSELISWKLIDLEIKEYNLSIDDSKIIKAIKENKNFLDKNGIFQRSKYENFLLSNNLTAVKFEDKLRKQKLTKLLFDSVVNGTLPPRKKVKVAKVEEPKQEEFKPENKDIDNDAPVIEIAQNIIVDSQTYTLKGKVKDKSRFQLTIDDRPIKVAKNGQFEFEGFAIDSKEQLKIVAIDRWKNKSEKVINVEVKIKQVADLRSYEKPNPSKIKVKKDNNKIGIIIGIEKYQNLNNIDAPYANRDAKAFKAYANIALGIPNNNLKVLIDEDATRGELLKSLKIWLPQITRGKGKDIYIFFAGHGLASDNGEDLHILPHNGDPILLEDTALSRIEMFDLINKVNPKSVTMFFDTCYSGQTRSEQMLIAGLRPVRIVADEQDTPNNFTIFTASNYDQTSGSINEAEHGIFSYYLMKGLEGKADENSDKKITNGELISYLKNNVTQEAFSQNRSQEPMLSGDPDKVLISYR